MLGMRMFLRMFLRMLLFSHVVEDVDIVVVDVVALLRMLLLVDDVVA